MAALLVLTEGTEVDILPLKTDTLTHYATTQDALAALERTLPEHEATCRELAK